jgi:fluoroacetyl-CoA thioesterase
MMSLMGRTAEATLRMFPPDTADELLQPSPGHHVPAVPAASRLIEVMELAAARVMRARLGDGESTVAVSTRLDHAALSRASGDMLRARASCVAIDGRLHRFVVNVFDENGLVASGEHVRALVSERRVEALARRRVARPSMLLQA